LPSFYIVLEKGISNADTFVNGNFLSQHSDELDKLARRLGVTPLMKFFSVGPDELALAAESGVDTSKMKKEWFSADDGLRTIRALQTSLASLKDREQLASELDEFANVLELAKSGAIRLVFGYRLLTTNF